MVEEQPRSPRIPQKSNLDKKEGDLRLNLRYRCLQQVIGIKDVLNCGASWNQLGELGWRANQGGNLGRGRENGEAPNCRLAPDLRCGKTSLGQGPGAKCCKPGARRNKKTGRDFFASRFRFTILFVQTADSAENTSAPKPA
jgi:hypothetical protein